MEKKIIFISAIFYVSITYGMEKEDRKNSQEIIIPPIKEKISRAGSNVPRLDLQDVIVHTPADSDKSKSGSSKQRVGSLKELGRCVSKKEGITRRATSRHGSSRINTVPIRKKLVITEDDTVNVGGGLHLPSGGDKQAVLSTILSVGEAAIAAVGDLEKEKVSPKEKLQKVPSRLPKILAQQSARSLDDEKCKDEEYVWNFLQAVNPALYDFALKHDLSLEEVEEYAILMEELDIDPSIINEYVHQNHTQKNNVSLLHQGLNYIWGDLRTQNMDNLAKKYEQIKKENPETYKQMILEVMKAASDLEAGGHHGRSTIADTHVALQNAEIEDKAREARLAYLGLLVTVFTAVGGWVFGVIGQIINPNNNCTG